MGSRLNLHTREGLLEGGWEDGNVIEVKIRS